MVSLKYYLWDSCPFVRFAKQNATKAYFSVASFNNAPDSPSPSTWYKIPSFVQTCQSWPKHFNIQRLSSSDAPDPSWMMRFLLQWQQCRSATLILGYLAARIGGDVGWMLALPVRQWIWCAHLHGFLFLNYFVSAGGQEIYFFAAEEWAAMEQVIAKLEL